MRKLIRGTPLAALLLTACSVEPEIFPPPPQRVSLPPAAAPSRSLMLSPADGSIDTQIVADIPAGPREPWRWVYQHPQVKLKVTRPAGLKYRIDFSIADATLKFTGPVTLRFLVNGKELGRKRYPAAGQFTWTAPVPPELLRVSEDNIVSAEVDKVWVSPGDGARLGFILSRIGLDR